jgi:hypothetical protein
MDFGLVLPQSLEPLETEALYTNAHVNQPTVTLAAVRLSVIDQTLIS